MNEQQNHLPEENDFSETAAQTNAFAQPIVQGTVINDETPENIGKGILGILIGALTGIALYNGLYALGFIAAITGFVMAWLSIFLYGKFSGKPGSTKGVILTVVIGLIATFAAVYLSWTITFYQELKELDVTFSDVALNLFPMIKELDIVGECVWELVKALFFTAFGAISTLFKKK